MTEVKPVWIGTAEDIERFHERISREGFIYYRDETDYKFGSDEPVIPKHTIIDVTIEKINKAREALVIFGLAPDQNGIDQALESRRYLFQIDYTEEETDKRLIDNKISPRAIIEQGKLEAEAGDNTLPGGLALQTLALQKGRGVLTMNGTEVEAHVNYHYLYKRFLIPSINGEMSHLFNQRYVVLEKNYPKQRYENIEMKFNSRGKLEYYNIEIMDMLRADVYRFLMSRFKPILTWGKKPGKLSTFLNDALYYGIKQMYFDDTSITLPVKYINEGENQTYLTPREFVEVGITTRKVPYGYMVLPTTKAFEFAMAIGGSTDQQSVNNLILYLLQEDVVRDINTRYKKALWKKPKFYTEKKIDKKRLPETKWLKILSDIRIILHTSKSDDVIGFHLNNLSEWFSPGHGYKIQVGFDTKYDEDVVSFKDWILEPAEKAFEKSTEQLLYGDIYDKKSGELNILEISDSGITVRDIAKFYTDGRATSLQIEELDKYLFQVIRARARAKVESISTILEIPERTFGDRKFQLGFQRFFFGDNRKPKRNQIRKIYGSPKLFDIPDKQK